MHHTFFTSDTHWGHLNIIKYAKRPYTSVAEMDEALIYNWNSLVAPRDVIYHLGNFAFTTEFEIAKILDKLNGRKYLIYGNHDKQIRASKELQSYFIKCLDYLELPFMEGSMRTNLVLSHYPMTTWNRANHGSIMLHGHTHGSLVHTKPSKIWDVGVDVNGYAPVEANEVLDRFRDFEFDSGNHRAA